MEKWYNNVFVFFFKSKPIHCYLKCQDTLIFSYFIIPWESTNLLSVHSHLPSHKEKHFNSVEAEKGLESSVLDQILLKKIYHVYIFSSF